MGGIEVLTKATCERCEKVNTRVGAHEELPLHWYHIKVSTSENGYVSAQEVKEAIVCFDCWCAFSRWVENKEKAGG